MKKTKMNYRGMGRKGFFEDIVELFMSAIALVVFGVILIVLFNASTGEKKDTLTTDISYISTNYDTYSILRTEIRPGYTVADLVVDSVNTKDYTKFNSGIEEVMRKYYDPQNRQAWVFMIGSYTYKHNSADVRFAAISQIEGVIVPNPYGENIRVLFKQVKESDKLFESRATPFVDTST